MSTDRRKNALTVSQPVSRGEDRDAVWRAWTPRAQRIGVESVGISDRQRLFQVKARCFARAPRTTGSHAIKFDACGTSCSHTQPPCLSKQWRTDARSPGCRKHAVHTVEGSRFVWLTIIVAASYPAGISQCLVCFNRYSTTILLGDHTRKFWIIDYHASRKDLGLDYFQPHGLA